MTFGKRGVDQVLAEELQCLKDLVRSWAVEWPQGLGEKLGGRMEACWDTGPLMRLSMYASMSRVALCYPLFSHPRAVCGSSRAMVWLVGVRQ